VLQKAEWCAAKILQKAEQLLSQGKDVVLDIATFKREHRDTIRAWAKEFEGRFSKTLPFSALC
jgi:predicted kinase